MGECAAEQHDKHITQEVGEVLVLLHMNEIVGIGIFSIFRKVCCSSLQCCSQDGTLKIAILFSVKPLCLLLFSNVGGTGYMEVVCLI